MDQRQNIEAIICGLEQAPTHPERLKLLEQLEQAVTAPASAAGSRLLISLLYHRDWYVRREAAFLIDRLGVKLSPEERWQYHFALQNWGVLERELPANLTVREILFRGCLDPSARFRSRLLTALSLPLCRTPGEVALFHYAAGDYLALAELGADRDFRPAVLDILHYGMKPQHNSNYHRRQCAQTLEHLNALENAAEVIKELIRDKKTETPAPETNLPQEVQLLAQTPMDKLLRQLARQGVWLDGKKVYPHIHIGSVTRRITYKNPNLQALPKEERKQRLAPPAGYQLLSWDYVAIEPTLLLHFLVERFLISLEDVPTGDIYLTVDPQDRKAGKRWLNTIINGGGRQAERLNRFQEILLQALKELRQELLQEVYRKGSITILGGEEIPLEKNAANLAGKATNRLIQGSASAVFHQALLALDEQLREARQEAQIYFLLHDEIWLCAGPDVEIPPLVRIAEETLLSVNTHFALLIPLKVRAGDLMI